MKFHARPKRTPTVIIVSLIDIFAILLIFVIVTTTFKKMQPEVTIKLPESTTAGASDQSEPPVILSIDRDSQLVFDAAPTTLEELPGLLAATVASKRRIALKADEAAPFGLIIKVLDALKKAGVTSGVSAFTESQP